MPTKPRSGKSKSGSSRTRAHTSGSKRTASKPYAFEGLKKVKYRNVLVHASQKYEC